MPNACKFILWATIVLSAYGCSGMPYVDGSSVLLVPQAETRAPLSPDQVTLYLDEDGPPHTSVALLTASATVGSYSDIARTEAALINELKRQAAQHGANGVTELVREVIAGDKVISVNAWGVGSGLRFDDPDQRVRHFITNTRHQGVISADYVIVYRARAVLATPNAEPQP